MDVTLAITEDPSKGEDSYSEFLGRFWWVEDVAEERDYDLLIETTAGPYRWDAHSTGDPCYLERIPWQSPKIFTSQAAHFPQEVLLKIAKRTRELIWEHGRNATVKLTDPEGTDVSWTLWEEYFENSPEGTDILQEIWDEYYDGLYNLPLRESSLANLENHVSIKAWPPVLEKDDASGVVPSTLGHHSRPYPQIKIHLEDSQITEIEGGGKKGDRMRDLLERTNDVKYPDFPREGMWWFWEYSIGTNPKVFRPRDFMMKSEPGTLVERLRSGIVHCGIGTLSPTYSEDWADENDEVYGHVDNHMNFPTLELHTENDKVVTLIEKGHLTVLDDAEVREVAAKHGDPDELLHEDWIPPLPGVNMEGDYEEYAAEPSRFLEAYVPNG